MSHSIVQSGTGTFGPIYAGVYGQEAVEFLLQQGQGEISSAFMEEGIGEIDLIWGVAGANGFGLVHILEFHKEDVFMISRIIECGIILTQAPDRKLLVYQSFDRTFIAAIKLDWNGVAKKWLLTAYGKNSP